MLYVYVAAGCVILCASKCGRVVRCGSAVTAVTHIHVLVSFPTAVTAGMVGLQSCYRAVVASISDCIDSGVRYHRYVQPTT
jgi:hypothetical protein